MCIQFQPINSIESAVPKRTKRMFNIQDEDEIVFEKT